MVICFFGDSLTLGTGDAACLGWAGRICVQALARGRALTCYNLGARRHSSADILARWRDEAARRALPGAATRLVFSFGVADAADRDGRRNLPLADTVANAETLLDQALAAHEVLFVGPPPVASGELTARIREINRELGTVCARRGVGYFDMFGRLVSSGAYLADVAANDGIHPASTGYAEMAAHVAGWPAWQEWVAV
ncbi:GDSL-type esterase/lipase family protein [Desulfocurvus vexinensis]|uniref:GDSL-type esterase/lipase family protein n=1 Tax=Desulfocurvus vexinensis TaxID=399548 RepID=UPI00048F52CA|nr:GDSL-type esterase/lipase family protein [Desulfocurvus vexinensis]